MLENMEMDMKQAVRLVDSLYTDLVTEGLSGEGSKNKLISMYERMIRINVAVIKDSVTDKDIVYNIIGYYSDLCSAMTYTFEYLRKVNVESVIEREYVESKFSSKIKELEIKVESLEEQLYQRGLEVEALGLQLTEQESLIIDKYIKPEYREKFRLMRETWVVGKENCDKQLLEKDSIIERLRIELDKLVVENKELKTLGQSDKVKKGKVKPAFKENISTEEIVKLYNDGNGMTPYAIAKGMGKPQNTIIYRLKQAGVYIDKK